MIDQPEQDHIKELQLQGQSNSQFKIKLQKLCKNPPMYKSEFHNNKIPLSLTFNDILMVPQYGQINSRSECDISSRFSHHIPLNVPIVSSPMDTVTQCRMAIEMARQGGLGILHRFMTIEEQSNQIEKVKRSGTFLNPDPITISAKLTCKQVQQMIKKWGITAFLVTEENKNTFTESPRLNSKKEQILIGIITQRDTNSFQFQDQTVSEVMTPIEKLITYEVPYNYCSFNSNININQIMQSCKKLLVKNKIQKIPIVKPSNAIVGLVSLSDIKRHESFKSANKDQMGKLFVGGAIGANKDYLQRAEALKNAGCDVLVVDVANGHSKLTMNATQQLKNTFPSMDIVAGSIATGEGAENLIRSGANGVRCGIGNGSICITRVVAGSGVPQLTAIMDTQPVCTYYDVPLCSDGGNKNSGNMCKALAMGANSVMIGRLVAGCEQSPGIAFNKDGKFVKIFRGMAGCKQKIYLVGANLSKQERTGGENVNPQTFNAEGVQGYIPFTGPLKYVLKGFQDGIRSGMSYSGAKNLKQLKQKVKFTQITDSGFQQSKAHSISQFQ